VLDCSTRDVHCSRLHPPVCQSQKTQSIPWKVITKLYTFNFARNNTICAAMLLKCARVTEGFSGRRLRKLPLLAFSMGRTAGLTGMQIGTFPFLKFLIAAAEKHANQSSVLEKDRNE
jgi:hypothetical protein